MRALGGTDEDWHRLTTPDGEQVIKEMARLVAEVRVFTVNYNRGIEHSCQAGRYDYVDRNVSSANFGCKDYDGKIPRVMTLVRLDRDATTEEVRQYMSERNLRPANINELLAFGEAEPSLQWKFTIIALGSTWNDGTRSYVAVLTADVRERILAIRTETGTWSSCDSAPDFNRFLGIGE